MGEDRSERRNGKTGEKRDGGGLLVADPVTELMGFCHFLSARCLLNRGLCIQKDH